MCSKWYGRNFNFIRRGVILDLLWIQNISTRKRIRLFIFDMDPGSEFYFHFCRSKYGQKKGIHGDREAQHCRRDILICYRCVPVSWLYCIAYGMARQEPYYYLEKGGAWEGGRTKTWSHWLGYGTKCSTHHLDRSRHGLNFLYEDRPDRGCWLGGKRVDCLQQSP